MKTVAILLFVAFEVGSTLAFAQRASDPAAQPTTGRDNWIVSETTSPVDYSPIVTATASSGDGSSGPAMQLSVQCRGGRTELAVAGPAIPRSSADYAISYRINGGQPVQL